MSMRWSLVPLLLVAAATLTGCGGDDADSNAPTTDDTTPSSQRPTGSAESPGSGDVAACDLLTTDEVAAAVGSPVRAGLPSSGPAATGGGYSSCVWQSDDPDNPADTATVTVYSNADAADSAREEDSQDVPGIGDHAFSASFGSMWVYVGDRSFFAQWYTFSGTDDENLARSEALATAVVGAL